MEELISINYDTPDRPTVSGRDLHDKLGVKTAYKDWFPRMCEYGLYEGVDFNVLKNERVHEEGNRTVARVITDHQLTIDAAKEICMIQRSDVGKQYRQYFLDLEKKWNSPEYIMKRALEIANYRCNQLEAQNKQLLEENEAAKPKVQYFDFLIDKSLLTNFTTTAKELGIKPKQFVTYLLDHKYIYRKSNGTLLPYENRNNDLFEVKETLNRKTGWTGVQTLVTPKGRQTFQMLLSVPGALDPVNFPAITEEVQAV